MAENLRADRALNVRMTADELERIEQLRQRIQARIGPSVRATQRTVILEALDRLEAYYAKLDKDRDRER